MMRSSLFKYLTPSTAAEAASMLASEGPRASALAGGTDLVPNMKRRHQMPPVLVALRKVEALRGVFTGKDGTVRIGSTVTLSELGKEGPLPEGARALRRAATLVATPLIRNVATIGGNVLLDTRCNYYNQDFQWRKAICFCKKAPGPSGDAVLKVEPGNDAVCWVAPGSERCWAVSSTDSAPALLALGATVTLVSTRGERTIPIDALYLDDGMEYVSRRPDELLTDIRLPALSGWRSTYWKLRRRGAFDFPALGVAAAVKLAKDGTVEEARLVLGAIASRPLVIPCDSLKGGKLTDDAIEKIAEAASSVAKPMDNTDFAFSWRRKVVTSYVEGAFRELRGDDPATFGLLARRAAQDVQVLY